MNCIKWESNLFTSFIHRVYYPSFGQILKLSSIKVSLLSRMYFRTHHVKFVISTTLIILAIIILPPSFKFVDNTVEVLLRNILLSNTSYFYLQIQLKYFIKSNYDVNLKTTALDFFSISSRRHLITIDDRKQSFVPDFRYQSKGEKNYKNLHKCIGNGEAYGAVR